MDVPLEDIYVILNTEIAERLTSNVGDVSGNLSTWNAGFLAGLQRAKIQLENEYEHWETHLVECSKCGHHWHSCHIKNIPQLECPKCNLILPYRIIV